MTFWDYYGEPIVIGVVAIILFAILLGVDNGD